MTSLPLMLHLSVPEGALAQPRIGVSICLVTWHSWELAEEALHMLSEMLHIRSSFSYVDAGQTLPFQS